ncbi:Sodium/hydrogen exchanger 9 [Thelohanellus kitauei]|uniref:Sodium/hydrogen exchanger 9 n=1 Tax=Thelohanellus kitauei TaxID=669202 RepID=A0A0C2JA54_THEKT|nr:Sodium/hydrogen exchanger 9 [Thelohanellus kitauei]
MEINDFTRFKFIYWCLLTASYGVFSEEVGTPARKNHEELYWLEGLREEEIDISHRTDSLSMLILTSLLIITVLSAWLFKLKKFGWFHETGFSLILGVIVGGLIRLSLNLLADEEAFSDTVTVHLLNANKLSVAPVKLVMNISNNRYLYYLAGVVTNNSDIGKFYPEDVEQLEAKSSFNPEVHFHISLKFNFIN